MRKYSSPYLRRGISTTKLLRESVHPFQRPISLERRFSQVKQMRQSSSSRYQNRIEKLDTQPLLNQQTSWQPSLYQCEISYNSRLFRMEFEYDMEHTTIGQFIQSVHRLLRCEWVVLHSGVLVVDYLLTLPRELFVQIAPQSLSITAQDTSIQQGLCKSLKQFNIMKCIGSGGFSKVYLCETLGQYFAMKVMNKDQVMRNQKQSIVLNEKAILMKMNSHPFATKLHYTIETEHTVVFVVEFCAGGELFNLLKQHRRMKEHQARFYFLEILSALHELHSNGIIYRDLKPENIVIDHQGHVRLADFGLSKFSTDDQHNESFCGSAEYMAPEMLLRKGHSKELDVYCLGALLYELVVGIPPYYSKDIDQMFYGILNQKLQLPSGAMLSEDIQDLLERMLLKVPESRPTLEEVLQHHWCGGHTLQQINLKLLQPPFKPNLLKYNFDDSEFGGQQTDDIALIFNEKQHGDLVLPLFRKFYYESEQMKKRKKLILEQPIKRSTSHTTSDTILKHSSKKLRLRTQQESIAWKSGSCVNRYAKNRSTSSKKGSAQKRPSNWQLPNSYVCDPKRAVKELTKCYESTSISHLPTKSAKQRPIKKIFKDKDHLKRLFGGRM